MVAAQHFVEPKYCPIFTISCVDGTNLDKLKKFLSVLPPLMNKTQREHDMQELPVFRVSYFGYSGAVFK
jgi:GTPase